MRIMSWNCQGLGGFRDLTIQRLKEIRSLYFPEILFLETKNKRDVLDDVQVLLGYDRLTTVGPEGYSGGLAIFWKDVVDMNFTLVNKNVVDILVQCDDLNFNLSFVYGAPDLSSRQDVWEQLMRLGVNRKTQWCIVGDFNEISHNGEKIGGPRRSQASFKPFNDMLDLCKMIELPSTGNSYTWAGRRYTLWIQSKLDRAFANQDWLIKYPKANQVFLDPTGSDHRPVLINLLEPRSAYRGQFKFDQRMIGKEGVREAIVRAWTQLPQLNNKRVMDCIRDSRKNLSLWKKETNANSKNREDQLKAAIEVEISSMYPCFQHLSDLKKELALAYGDEEKYWRQRSRQLWLKLGDQNTHFFHTSVKADRHKKRIVKLYDEDGLAHTSEAAKANLATSYFKELFSTTRPQNLVDFFSRFPVRITPQMNNLLLREVTPEDVRKVVFSIKPSSAPGIDGMDGAFFQNYWDIIGAKVSEEVIQFFETCSFPSDWSHTLICLIPKKDVSEVMRDLRPISLCSVLYKIISKIIVQRLKPMMPQIVSPTQSAFVQKRLISDNIIIAHEALHSLRTKTPFAETYMAIKTDVSKAYDRLEWNYLETLLEAFGFDRRWIQLVLLCVRSVNYSVLMNGQRHESFSPERGLRQGDPLSPLLFVLCTEGLIYLLNRAESRREIQGIQFSDTGPMVHHLLFADDSLFFCQATIEQCVSLLSIFQEYESVTGQVINQSKSAITFGSKIPADLKILIQAKLNIYSEGGTGNYLGLPECFSGSKVQLLNYIQEKLNTRLSGWYNGTLSTGGKEVLIKSVTMSMPVYAMTCFRLPKQTCENLTSAIANFWWNANEDKRKIHWISWEKLCLPKDKGGMGFRDIELFNQALLAKQAWRIITEPESLFARVLKSIYFVKKEFLAAGMSSRPSFAWRSILHGRELLMTGLRRMVGNGESIRVWSDSWILDGTMRRPLLYPRTIDLNMRVCDLFESSSGRWDRGKLEELFFPGDIEKILKIKPNLTKPDFWIWYHNRSGNYSVKSGNWLNNRLNKKDLLQEAEALPSINLLKDQLWNVHTAPKIKTFLWKAISGALASLEALHGRGVRLDRRCLLCGLEDETTNHILFTCSHSRHIWDLSLFPLPSSCFHTSSIYYNFNHVLEQARKLSVPLETRRLFPWTLWNIWKNRNKVLFEGRLYDPLETMIKIRADMEEWFKSQESGSGEATGSSQRRIQETTLWQPPEHGFLKCNIGVSLSSKRRILGGSWIVRDHTGKALLHSSRAFSFVDDIVDAKHIMFLWAIDCMKSHCLDKVHFAIECRELIGGITNIVDWPAFSGHVAQLLASLQGFLAWKVEHVDHVSNRCARLIAMSVTWENRWRSYVELGAPTWLYELMEEENNHISLT